MSDTEISSPLENQDAAPISVDTDDSANKTDKQTKFTVKYKKPKSARVPKSQKQATAPIRLNRRMRKLEREAQDKALAPLNSVASTEVKQENFSSNWTLLQQVLDSKESSTTGQKRRRESSSASLNESSKRPRHVANTDSSNGSVDANITEQLLEDTSDNDDDSDECYSSCPENSDDEEPVEFDMDQQEQFFDKATKSAAEAKAKKEANKIKNLQKSVMALDCEMVGVGLAACESALGRVSIVDRTGNVRYDKYVKPLKPVTDYRTKYSGIRPENLADAPQFSEVHAEVAKMLKGRLLVGHGIENDLRSLMLSHPPHLIRDTSLYQPFRAMYNNLAPSLKNLSRDILALTIQQREHDSVTDAKATMQLYIANRKEWEDMLTSGIRDHYNTTAEAGGAKKFRRAPRNKKKNKKLGGRFAKNKSKHGKRK